MFIGHKGTDKFFHGVVLRNGWVLKDAFVSVFGQYKGGAYVESFNQGHSLPIVNVRWWTEG